jgi:chemotaxis protein CheY-P-specific phosphatase CheC
MVGDTEDLEMVIDEALKHEFLIKEKNKYVIKSEFLADEVVCKTKKALKAFLNENVSVYMDLRNRVLSYLIGEDVTITLPSEKLEQEEKLSSKKKKMKTVKEVREERKRKEEEFDQEVLKHV